MHAIHLSMKSGPFIKLIAESYRIPESTVRVYMRWLRQAGFITQGASGRGAPDMKPDDAAKITIAILGTDKPVDAVDAFLRFGNLSLNSSYCPEQASVFQNEEMEWPSLWHVLTDYFSGTHLATALVIGVEVCREKLEAKVMVRNKAGIISADGVPIPPHEIMFDSDVTEHQKIAESGAGLGKLTVARLEHFPLSGVAIAFMKGSTNTPP